MKTFLSLLILLSAMHAQAHTADEWVWLAMSMKPEFLDSTGPISCVYPRQINAFDLPEPKFNGHGQSRDEAFGYLFVQCVRSRCQQTGQWIQKFLETSSPVTDQDFMDFAQSQGFDEDSRENISRNRKNLDPASFAKMTCVDGTELSRIKTVESCSQLQIKCHRK
jgi:hypothetical protein